MLICLLFFSVLQKNVFSLHYTGFKIGPLAVWETAQNGVWRMRCHMMTSRCVLVPCRALNRGHKCLPSPSLPPLPKPVSVVSFLIGPRPHLHSVSTLYLNFIWNWEKWRAVAVYLRVSPLVQPSWFAHRTNRRETVIRQWTASVSHVKQSFHKQNLLRNFALIEIISLNVDRNTTFETQALVG